MPDPDSALSAERPATPILRRKAPKPKAAKAPAAPRALKPEAAMEPAPKIRDPNVAQVRITHMGDGKVFTGETPRYRRPEYDQGQHWFPTYAKGDTPILPRKVAEALQDKGYAEIQD